MLAPHIEVYAPWRDPAFLQNFGGRSEMIAYCQGHGLPITATPDKPYSTDANMLGLTHEAGQLEALDTAASLIAPGMGLFSAAGSRCSRDFYRSLQTRRPNRHQRLCRRPGRGHRAKQLHCRAARGRHWLTCSGKSLRRHQVARRPMRRQP